MINQLKTLMIQQLEQVFGEVAVYDEPVQQGLITPSFMVLVYNSTQEPAGIFDRMKRTYNVNINYFPSSEDKRSECDEVLQTFQNDFRYLGKIVRVPKIEGAIQDGVLVITFNLTVHLRQVQEGIKMLTLTQEGFIRD